MVEISLGSSLSLEHPKCAVGSARDRLEDRVRCPWLQASRARTSAYWDRLHYVMLASFFGRQKLLLEEISKPMRKSGGIVNLTSQGAFLRPRSVRSGQHNRRAKDLPPRTRVPPTQGTYHD